MALARRRAPLFGLIAAAGFSLLGASVAGVALPWFVLTLTDSAVWTGVAAALGAVPLVLGAFFGGPIVDRFGARRVAVTADLISAVCVAAVPVLFLLGQLNLGLLLVLIVVGALLDGPGLTAQDVRMPELARLAGLPVERVTAIDELLENAAIIVGPPLAGLAIVALGIERTLFITAGCSLAAALFNTAALPRHRRKALPDHGVSAFLVGTHFLFNDRLLRTLLGLAMVVMAIFGAMGAVILPALIRARDASALDLGLYLAVGGGGASVAALAFAKWGHQADGRRILLCGIAGAALGIAGVALSPPGPLMLVAGGVVGLSTGALGPLVNAVFLRRAPSAIRGSVLGASTAAALVATPAAVLAAGFGVEALGAGPLLLGLSGLMALMALTAVVSPALRALGHRPSTCTQTFRPRAPGRRPANRLGREPY